MYACMHVRGTPHICQSWYTTHHRAILAKTTPKSAKSQNWPKNFAQVSFAEGKTRQISIFLVLLLQNLVFDNFN